MFWIILICITCLVIYKARNTNSSINHQESYIAYLETLESKLFYQNGLRNKLLYEREKLKSFKSEVENASRNSI